MADEILTDQADEQEAPDTAAAEADEAARASAPVPSAPVDPVQAGSVTMNVWRGDAEGGEFTEYELPAQEGEVVLDVIHRVQAVHVERQVGRARADDPACFFDDRVDATRLELVP